MLCAIAHDLEKSVLLMCGPKLGLLATIFNYETRAIIEGRSLFKVAFTIVLSMQVPLSGVGCRKEGSTRKLMDRNYDW